MSITTIDYSNQSASKIALSPLHLPKIHTVLENYKYKFYIGRSDVKINKTVLCIICPSGDESGPLPITVNAAVFSFGVPLMLRAVWLVVSAGCRFSGCFYS